MNGYCLHVGRKGARSKELKQLCFLPTRRNTSQFLSPNTPSITSALPVVFNPGYILKPLGSFKNTGDFDLGVEGGLLFVFVIFQVNLTGSYG